MEETNDNGAHSGNRWACTGNRHPSLGGLPQRECAGCTRMADWGRWPRRRHVFPWRGLGNQGEISLEFILDSRAKVWYTIDAHTQHGQSLEPPGPGLCLIGLDSIAPIGQSRNSCELRLCPFSGGGTRIISYFFEPVKK